MAEPAVVPAAPAGTVEEYLRARLSRALGGVRGSLESTAPMLAFVLVWTIREDARLALGVAAALTAVLLLARLAARETVQFVLSSVLATGLAAFFALRSGRAEDAFLPGILTSLAWAVLSIASIPARLPLVGFLLGAAPEDPADPFAWRRDPGILRVCSRLTLVVAAVYLVRVLVMGPLYLAGQVGALAVCKVVLGWPLWAAAVALMGLMLVRGATPRTLPAPRAED